MRVCGFFICFYRFYKQQQQLYNSWKDIPYTGYGGGPNYAYASGAYGLNNGIHQTAGVFPPNKVSVINYLKKF